MGGVIGDQDEDWRNMTDGTNMVSISCPQCTYINDGDRYKC